MQKFWKILKVMIQDCKFIYFFYFFLLFLSVFFTITSSYLNKILIDVLQAQENLGGIGTPITEISQLGNDVNILTTFFVTIFGGIEFLSSNLWMFAVLIVGFALIAGVNIIIRMIMRSSFMNKMSKNLQLLLFSHIERLPYSKIKGMKNGDIIQTCTRDEDILRRFAGPDLTLIVYTFYIVLLSFIFLAITNWMIALISICILPLMFIYSFFVIKEVRRRYRLTDDSEGNMTDKIEENLASVRLVKAFNNETYEINSFEKYIVDFRNKYLNWRKLSAFFFASSDVFVFSQIALTTIFGFILCYNNAISIGTLFVSFTFVNLMVWPVRDVATVLSNLARANASLDRINLILEEPLEDTETGLTPPIKGNIVFDKVSFFFCDSNQAAIDNVSFSVKEGQTVAIMGKTGSGKSTLAYLLTRLYDYTSGSIKVDGVELKEIKKSYLRKEISIVLQDPFLFSKTIKDNIRIARQNADEKEIIAATSISQIHANILQFPNGYNTPVGEKGTTLSGGQKQRVAIARTLLSDAPVLIFDDSLSALDTETDYNIRKALKEKSGDRTTFIITHRIATAKDADLILVLENGKISEMGKHNDLIKKEGLYKRIYEIQTKME